MRKLLVVTGLLLSFLAGITRADSSTKEYLNSARQSLEQGKKEDALAAATKAVDGDSKNPSCYATRAMIQDARHDFEKAVADYSRVIELMPNVVGGYQRRGEDYFRMGKFAESVADFDKVIQLEPKREPYHWQRGISLYYAGEFERGARQFEGHKAVNPNDVENAVWHYLCVARLSGIEKARAGMIKIEGDSRVPMMRVYAMYLGTASAADVLKEAETGEATVEERKMRLFYAHLYIGLYQEAAGQLDQAREHILLAAQKYAGDDYMGDVARVHETLLKHEKSPSSQAPRKQ